MTEEFAGYGRRLAVCLTILLALFGCADSDFLKPAGLSRYPLFLDDASVEGLVSAIDHQIAYLNQQPKGALHRSAAGSLTTEQLSESLRRFREIVSSNRNPIEISRLIRNEFTLFEAPGRTGKQDMLVTGYYEPLFKASLEKRPPYLYPVYSVPASLVMRRDSKSKALRSGRIDKHGNLVSYWSRREIETDNRARGYELAYLSDPLDAYLLQIQGSGRILLPDGTNRSLHFAASNGLPYNSLGKLLVDEGHLTREQVSVPAIREFFKSHPNELPRMLQHNPRYTFFRWGDEAGPRGSLGRPLTPGRSIAIDHGALPGGTIAYLVSQRPVLKPDGSISHWRPFGRFVLPQDSGAAIAGPGRVDLFFGSGQYAEVAASHMQEPGRLFFLVKKTFELPAKIR